MHSFFSIDSPITYLPLSSQDKNVKELAVNWFYKAWGKNKVNGKKHSEEEIEKNEENIQIVFLDNKAVAMFLIKPYFDEFFFNNRHQPRPQGLELDMVYVDESVRGRGIGRKIIEKAKSIAQEKQEDIILEVFEHKLIGFYRRSGAIWIARRKCEGRETEVMRIDIKPTNN